MKSRREFLKLVAAGSAAALTTRARTAAASAKRAARHAMAGPAPADTTPPKPAVAAIAPAIREEIEKQKKSTAGTLKTLRDYDLPAGSPMAFSFAALKPRRAEGR